MGLTKGFREIRVRKNEEIQIRDPFIFPYKKRKKVLYVRNYICNWGRR